MNKAPHEPSQDLDNVPNDDLDNILEPEVQQQLVRLENRVTDLLAMLERLMQENHQLKAERTHFLKKNKRIQIQVEGMINRLKAMEKNNGESR